MIVRIGGWVSLFYTFNKNLGNIVHSFSSRWQVQERGTKRIQSAHMHNSKTPVEMLYLALWGVRSYRNNKRFQQGSLMGLS